MDKYVANQHKLHYSIAEPIEYGKKDSVPLDQSAVQPFNIDPTTGRPLYDLTAILRAQTKADQQKILDSMVTFDSDFLPDDITSDMALEYSVPRLAQMPSELAELTEKINEVKFKKWMEQKEIEDEKKAREEYDELVKSIRAERQKEDVESKES